MGNSWSPKPEALEEHKLITSGQFSFCRHPMYTGMLYHTIPILLLTLNWFITLTWLILMVVAFIVIRIPLEEKILVDIFGEEYTEYQKKVPALGPGTHFMTKGINEKMEKKGDYEKFEEKDDI